MTISLQELQCIFEGQRHDHPGRKSGRMSPPRETGAAQPVPRMPRIQKERLSFDSVLDQLVNQDGLRSADEIQEALHKVEPYVDIISEKQEQKETKQWLEQRKQFANIKKSLRKRHNVAS